MVQALSLVPVIDHFSTTLEEFYATINIPYYGRLDSPGFRDYEAFYHSLCVGEDRDLSWAKLTSIQFPSVHYFALFISRCLLAKTDCTNTCAPDRSSCSRIGTRKEFHLPSSPGLADVLERSMHMSA